MGIQVTVTFEFPDIDDPGGEPADRVVELITEKTKEWQGQTWHDNQTQCTVWVDEAQAAPHLHVSDESRSYGPRL
jgi:hypothetical protein